MPTQPATDPISDAPPPALAAPSGGCRLLALWKRLFSLDNRFLAPLLVSCTLLAGELTFGVLESWVQTALAIVTAMVTEAVLGRFVLGRWPNLASAYIAGTSAGMLLRSPFMWPFVVGGMLTIMSKYVLRWKGRHLWNPSNFGVSAMLFLYPSAVAALSVQWGNAFWPMIIIWTFGTIIIWRVRRFHICLTYVSCFLLFAYFRSQITGVPWIANVAPLTGPMYQLYVFFMITDPKTNVSTRWGQCLVAALVAAVEMVLRLGQVINAPFYALFLVGAPALAVELAWKDRASRRVPKPELACCAPQGS